MNIVYCQQCNKKAELEHKVGFREECPHCGSDLHTCLNCRFYDTSAYNECKESSAERVLNKDRNNYCEYFDPIKEGKDSVLLDRAEQLKKAEALFKKNF